MVGKPVLVTGGIGATGSHAVDVFAVGLSAQARVRHLAARVLAACPRLGVPS